MFVINITSLWLPFSWVSLLFWFHKNRVLRSMQYRFVCIQYSYYREFVCSWPASHFHYRHCTAWMRFNYTNKSAVACMSSLLLSIYLQQICYLISFSFKLNNGAKGNFISLKYWICLFVSFTNTIFSLMIKNKETLIRYSNK